MRESRSRRSPRPEVSQRRRTRDGRSGYVTLREASAETGIPINTLRKWARHEAVDSYLDTEGERTLRMVLLADVEQRAVELGREDRAEAPPPPLESGTMIVPIDAWNKMLLQLGNLHEAGQQLAEARERAAKAETEAAFLRERLAETRVEPVAPPPSVEDTPAAHATIPRWRAVYRSWRRG